MKTTALRERVNLVIALTVRSPLRVEVARSLRDVGRQGGGQARGEVPEAQRAAARTLGPELLLLRAQVCFSIGPFPPGRVFSLRSPQLGTVLRGTLG